MPSSQSNQHQLTERNLFLHNQLLQRQDHGATIVSWAEKVIAQERIHQFCSQFDTNNGASDTTSEQRMESLKLFEPKQGICLESPLERFLTPDGCSDPSYFGRMALAQIGMQFGSMDGRTGRTEVGKRNAELVYRKKHGLTYEHESRNRKEK